jgi:hypothetical protein
MSLFLVLNIFLGNFIEKFQVFEIQESVELVPLEFFVLFELFDPGQIWPIFQEIEIRPVTIPVRVFEKEIIALGHLFGIFCSQIFHDAHKGLDILYYKPFRPS